MKVVSFINEKGGTSKTTFAVNFAAYFAHKRGRRVLLLDLDSQGHAGKSLGLPVNDLEHTAFDLLTRPGFDPRSAAQATRIPGLTAICANRRMAEFPEAVARAADRETRLVRALRRLPPQTYDYVFIDSPPSWGLIATNILAASGDVIVPVALTYLALDGCAEIVRSIRTVSERVPEARPRLSMVIPTLYRPTRLANEIAAKLVEHFGDRVSKTILGFNVKIDEAQSFGKTIWEYEPEGRAAAMLETLAVELYNKVLRKA